MEIERSGQSSLVKQRLRSTWRAATDPDRAEKGLLGLLIYTFRRCRKRVSSAQRIHKPGEVRHENILACSQHRGVRTPWRERIHAERCSAGQWRSEPASNDQER